MEAHTVVSMKMAAVWNTALSHRPHDGGSKNFWNVALFIRDYTAQICKDYDLNDFSIMAINFPLKIAVISRYFITFMKCQYLFIFTEKSLIH
jgi:hypothetical protein